MEVTRKCHLFGTICLDCLTLFANFSLLKCFAFSFPAVRCYRAVLLPQNYYHPVADSSSGKMGWNDFEIILLQLIPVVFLKDENFRWFYRVLLMLRDKHYLTAEIQHSKTRLWLEKLVVLTATILVWNGSPKPWHCGVFIFFSSC